MSQEGLGRVLARLGGVLGGLGRQGWSKEGWHGVGDRFLDSFLDGSGGGLGAFWERKCREEKRKEKRKRRKEKKVVNLDS